MAIVGIPLAFSADEQFLLAALRIHFVIDGQGYSAASLLQQLAD
jgi:hypothetical protein